MVRCGIGVLALGLALSADGSLCPERVRTTLPPRLNERAAGVLLAVSSLPGSGSVGDFGGGYSFVDFLARAKQRWWQILPLNPPDEVNSPFKSDSSLAIDVAYLSLERLAKDGLIEVPSSAASPASTADFRSARGAKQQAASAAHHKFFLERPRDLVQEFVLFKLENAYWLQAHAEFQVLRGRYGYDFTRWPAEFRNPSALALSELRRKESLALESAEFEQFLLHRQWADLRSYAHARGIGIIGDMPLYVGRYSADVWANRVAFWLDSDGNALKVSGYPPCNFYRDGQLWDTPVYNWGGLKRSGYLFWVNRLKRNFALYDVVRLDHFMGLHQFYAVDAGKPHARDGQWMPADGAGMLREVRSRLGTVPLVAEDLGAGVPKAVHRLRQRFGIPGMRIAQFGYDLKDGDPYHRTDNFEAGYVAYPGNHDMPTLAQWIQEAGGGESHWIKLGALYGSKANTVVVSAQDLLGLGADARMNVPGTWATATDPAHRRQNWTWRLLPSALDARVEGALEAQMKDAKR